MGKENLFSQMKGVSLFSITNNVLVNINEQYIHGFIIIGEELYEIFNFLNFDFPFIPNDKS